MGVILAIDEVDNAYVSRETSVEISSPTIPRAITDFDTQWVGSIRFIAASPELAASGLIALALKGGGTHVHLANAYTIALADSSEEYRDILCAPALNFPDGKPIGWVSLLKGHSPRLLQVRGPQLFLDIFRDGREHRLRHYLLGSKPEVLKKLKVNLLDQFPGCEIVGIESPPFRVLSEIELAEQDARIAESGAHIVWVGLGTPKQDREAKRLSRSLPVTAIAIGAAFDFAAGTVAVAPKWMILLGFEWIFRFATEPRRLWRRYIFGNVRFVKAAMFSPSNTPQIND